MAKPKALDMPSRLTAVGPEPMVARELIVDVDDEARRLVWAVVGGRPTHHNGSLQVFPEHAGRSRVVWIADLLPNELASTIAGLMFALQVVLLEGAGPIDGLRRSAGLVGNNLGRAIGLVVGAMVAAFVTWLASLVLHFIPVVGNLASILIAGVFFTYVTIVFVRAFQTLPRR